MIEKITKKEIFAILLVLSLLVNLSYLADSKSKHLYIKEMFSQLNEDFASAVHTLYVNLSLEKDNDFKDKNYIDDELTEAIDKIDSYDKFLYRLSSLSNEFEHYNHFFHTYYYLSNLREKETFTKEDYEKIRELDLLVTRMRGTDINRVKFLYKLTPTEAFNNMSKKISDICTQ